jgi:DNA-dependent RNA polymerase
LIGDTYLAEQLNITESSWNDIPKDFYTFVSLMLKIYFKEQINIIKENHNINMNANSILNFNFNNETYYSNLNKEDKNKLLAYERLFHLDIHRSLIKKPVMTKPYNVSQYQMIKYIQDEFIYDSNQRDKENK